MFRWFAVLATVVLAVSVAYGQSSPQSQPTLPLGPGQTMGSPMHHPMMSGNVELEHGMMSMMQMMHMMESGMMGSGMNEDMMGHEMGGSVCRGQMAMMHAAGMEGSPASHLEARLAFVRTELAITAAQDAVWQEYATVLRDQARPMQADMTAKHDAMMGNATFPAKFDARIAMLEGRLASLKAVREAAATLYGKLDGGQKKKADDLLPMSLCL